MMLINGDIWNIPSATAVPILAAPDCPAILPGEHCTGNDSRSHKGGVGREEGQPGLAAELPHGFLPGFVSSQPAQAAP